MLSALRKFSHPVYVAIFFCIFLLFPIKTKALNFTDFKPGRIIDDVVFTNKSSMNLDQIQAFLNSKVPTCDRNHAGFNQTLKRYTDAQGREVVNSARFDPPFTCLKDYQEHPTQTYTVNYSYINTSSVTVNASVVKKVNNSHRLQSVTFEYFGGNPANGISRTLATYVGVGGGSIAGAKTAAQIIFDAAQTYNINPQALIVTLEKETSIVTDDWAAGWQYDRAMGWACPDTGIGQSANCDASKEGFMNQVMGAGWQYRNDFNGIDTPNFWSPYGKGVYSILYNPNVSCGSRSVNIENQATAVLYKYTPYTPNDAAITASPGVTVTCGAYGNRNFWRLFNIWFGSTLTPSFLAELHKNQEYIIVNRGDSRDVYFYYKNIGTAFWKDDKSSFPGYPPVRLAATSPINRWSEFRDTSWLSGSRPSNDFDAVFESDGSTLTTDQHTVMPGQIVRFKVKFVVNTSIPGGVYGEIFQPILEGSPNWNMGALTTQTIGVHIPIYQAAFHSQSTYPTIAKNSSQSVFIRFRNTGNMPWYDTSSVPAGQFPVRLATSWPINRSSIFNNTWPASSRPSVEFTRVLEADGTTPAASQDIVQPGQVAEFGFNLSTPNNAIAGFYPEYFEPIREGAPGFTWNMGAVAWLGVTVP